MIKIPVSFESAKLMFDELLSFPVVIRISSYPFVISIDSGLKFRSLDDPSSLAGSTLIFDGAMGAGFGFVMFKFYDVISFGLPLVVFAIGPEDLTIRTTVSI